MNSGKLNSPVKRRNVAAEFPCIKSSWKSTVRSFVPVEGRLTEDNKTAISALSSSELQFGISRELNLREREKREKIVKATFGRHNRMEETRIAYPTWDWICIQGYVC